MSYNGADLIFPHLGIVIPSLPRSITLPIGSGFSIAFYGIVITLGMFLGLLLAQKDAKRRGQDPEMYLDLMFWLIVIGVLCARIYYIVFEWDAYRGDIFKMINIREGGLAIYGGIIGGCLAAYVFSKRRKVSFLMLMDTVMPAVLVGQILGRWGNFFNCEAFGGYTDSLFAMRIREALVNPSMISAELAANRILDGGVSYIQVHPTFLYESAWNLLSLLFLLWFGKKRQSWTGQIFCMYFLFYGIGRAIIEGLRTDSLMIPGTPLRVSQCLSVLLALAAALVLILNRKKPSAPDPAA